VSSPTPAAGGRSQSHFADTMTEIRALLFDVNGTLIDIETDEWMEEAYRAIAHFLTYQGIRAAAWRSARPILPDHEGAVRGERRKYPEFDVVAVWRELLRRHATGYTRSLSAGKAPADAAVPGRTAARDFAQAAGGVSANAGDSGAAENALIAWRWFPMRRALTPYPSFGRRPGRLLCAPIVISGDYGYRKPDPRLFQAALNGTGRSPGRGDFRRKRPLPRHSGARQVGMKTILVLPQRQPRWTSGNRARLSSLSIRRPSPCGRVIRGRIGP
jgi:putative hydrolase of the HAD superfamily